MSSANADGTAPVRVLYVGGTGRSGSTLLDRIVGEAPGAVSLGEIVHLWARGVRDDERCGCGATFSACDFWRAVGDRAFGGWDRIDVDRVLSLQHAVDRNRFVPMMLAGGLAPGYRRRLRTYGGYVQRVLRAAADVAGADVVVDSSKHASTAYLYRGVPGIDLRVIHLVRDPRGVAYSWTKQVVKPEVAGRDELMPRFRPAKMARWWLAFNASFDVLPVTGVPTMLMRYESLVERPRYEARRALTFAGLPVADAPTDRDGRAVRLTAAHTVAGNPMRFETGTIALRLDEAWRTELPPSDVRTVTTVTRPLLRRYGYEVHP